MRPLTVAALLYLGLAFGPVSATPSLNGFWQSDGYGFVLEIAGHRARLYSTGEGVCVLETDEFVLLDDLLPGVAFLASGDGRRINITIPMEPHRIGAYRRDALPEICANRIPSNPGAVLDTLLGYVYANYPLLSRHTVDWPVRVNAAQQRVRADMSDCELFAVLDWLIRPVRDAHVSLVAEVEGARHVSAPGRAHILRHVRQSAMDAGNTPEEAVRAFRQAVWFDSVQDDLLLGQGHIAGHEQVQYGMLNPRVGYLALATMDGFGPVDATSPNQRAETQELLDRILLFFEAEGARSILLDLSLNSGGSDYIARDIASRFVERATVAYTKYAADAETPIETEVLVAPHIGRRFDGSVFLLTSHITVSAAEVLVLALREQSNVIHYGERTRGALSDAVTRSLPNGWQLSLPNEVYLDADGRSWEGQGIPPDVEIPVFLRADPVASHRQAVRLVLDDARSR